MLSDSPSNPMIRKELQRLLRTDSDFEAFCLDYFPDAQQRFSGGMDRVAKENLLLQLHSPDKIQRALESKLALDQAPQPPASDQLSSDLRFLDDQPPWPGFARQWRSIVLGARRAIRNFLEEYVGTPQQPAPFGGRATDKRRLLEWVAAPESPPYLVLREVTGRGKSALIAHILAAVSEQEDLDLIFVPVISMRLGLATASDVWSALVAQFDAVSGTKSSSSAEPETAKALLSEHLRRPAPSGRRRLVIIDGLDEVVGWDFERGLFPRAIPPGTKVLLSWRKLEEKSGAEWRTQLGLGPQLVEERSLPLLSQLDVLEALHSVAPPSLDNGREALLASRLFKLCRGEPLVLGLLLDECQQPKGLAQLLDGQEIDLREGLEGCWERMLKPSEQDALSPDNKTPTWRLLALLSCAQAPLLREELMALGGIENGAALDGALKPVRRWILRDGDSYIFNHPALREFVQKQKVGPLEEATWHGRFVRWGDSVLGELSSGARRPAEVPSYLRNWLSWHLVRLGAGPEAFLRLLSTDWRRAQVRFQSSDNGLLQDTERTFEAVAKACRTAMEGKHSAAEPVYLPELIRCALWRSGAQSTTGNLELELLVPLVQHGLLTEKQVLFKLRHQLSLESPHQHAHRNFPALRAVMSFLLTSLPDETMDLAVSIADKDLNWGEQGVFLGLMAALAHKDPAAALMRVHGIKNRWLKIRALLTVATAEQGRDEKRRALLEEDAQKLIEKLRRPHEFLNSVALVFPSLSSKNAETLLAMALTEARSISDPTHKSAHLLSLRKTIPEPSLREEVYLEAVAAALESSEPFDADRCLLDLKEVSNVTAKAALVRLVKKERYDAIVSWLLANDAIVLERHSLLKECLSEFEIAQVGALAARAASSAWQESSGVDRLLKLIAIGAADEALAIVRNTPEERKKQAGLLRLVEILPQQEQLKLFEQALSERFGYQARDLVRRLMSMITTLPRGEVRRILKHAADPLARAFGLFDLIGSAEETEIESLYADLNQIGDEISDPLEQLEILERAFFFSWRVELFDELLSCAATVTKQTGEAWHESLLLEKLARHVGDSHRNRVLVQLIDVIELMPAHSRGMEFERLLEIPELPPIFRKQAVDRWKKVARGHEVVALLSYLDSGAERVELLKHVMDAAQGIDDEDTRILAAAAFASSRELCEQLIGRAKVASTLEARFQTLVALENKLPIARELARAEALSTAEPLVLSRDAEPRLYLLRHSSPDRRRVVVDTCYARILELFQELAATLKHWRGLPVGDRDLAYHDLSIGKKNAVQELRSLLFGVAEHLDATAAERVLESIPWFWSDVAARLLPALPPACQVEQLAAQTKRARDLPTRERVGTLAQLCAYVPVAERTAALSEVLSCAVELHSPGMVAHLAPWVEACHLSQLVELLPGVRHPNGVNLGGLVERIPLPLRKELVQRFYEKVSEPNFPQGNVYMIQLARFLEGDALAKAVRCAELVDNPLVLEPLASASNQLSVAQLEIVCKRLWAAGTKAEQSLHESLISAFGVVAGELVRRAPEHSVAMFEYAVQLLRQCSTERPQLLRALTGLAPLLLALGPSGIGDRLAHEIRDVGLVWPASSPA